MPYLDGDPWPNDGTAGSVLDATPNALIDANGELTQPAFFSLADGLDRIRFYGPLVTETGDSELTAPHASASMPVDGFFVCGKGRAIRNAEGDPNYGAPGVAQYDWVLGKKGVLIDDDANVSLAVRVEDGAIFVGWWGTDGGFDKNEFWLGSGVDCYEATEVAGSLVCDVGGDHVVTVYVRDDADRTVTVGGRGWREVGSDTVSGTTDIRDDTTLDWQVGDGKGFFSYVEWYEWDGTDATLLQSCHPDTDATAWDGPADTFVTDGTTWTLGDNSMIIDATTRGFAGAPGGGGEVTRFDVADNTAINPGTGDWCWVAYGVWGFVSTGNPLRNILAKATPPYGGGGSGVLASDYSVFGGVGMAVFAGGGPGFVGAAWTPGEHILVYNCHRDTDDIDVWLDGVKVDTLDVSGFPDLGAAAPLQVLPYLYVGYTFAVRTDRSLTDHEITVTLPAELR